MKQNITEKEDSFGGGSNVRRKNIRTIKRSTTET